MREIKKGSIWGTIYKITFKILFSKEKTKTKKLFHVKETDSRMQCDLGFSFAVRGVFGMIGKAKWSLLIR